MTYFIGIDLAKYKHDCFIMNQNGDNVNINFTNLAQLSPEKNRTIFVNICYFKISKVLLWCIFSAY